jgi:acetyl esterase/lipase
MTTGNGPAGGDIEIRRDVVYADHEGKLLGDFYLPKGITKAPVLIAVHGGGWARRNRPTYQYWGPFLAKNGYAVFEITYRTGKAGVYPRAVNDVKSCVQFVRARADDFGIDPDRIGLMGDSAGGHLSSMIALAADEFNDHRDEPNGKLSAQVKVVVSFYGIYDMLAQWQFDLVAQPNNSLTENFLGISPLRNRRIFFDSSPISYAMIDRTAAKFLLIVGTDDDIVDPAQTKAFQNALGQAAIKVRRIVVPGAGHSFAGEPFENIPHSINGTIAPRVLYFLHESL